FHADHSEQYGLGFQHAGGNRLLVRALHHWHLSLDHSTRCPDPCRMVRRCEGDSNRSEYELRGSYRRHQLASHQIRRDPAGDSWRLRRRERFWGRRRPYSSLAVDRWNQLSGQVLITADRAPAPRRASPCLGWRVVSPCRVRVDFWISHYITLS